VDFDAILFDCDGTLIDSEPICNQVLSELITEAGIPMTPDECMHAFIGTNLTFIHQWMREQKGVVLSADFNDRCRAMVRERCVTDLKEMPGAKAVLEQLTGTSLKRAVVSNSGPEYLRYTLGLTGLLPLLEPHVYSAHQVARPKPAPDIYLFAATSLGVSPGRCLVVEDTWAGVTAAAGAGARVAALASGAHATEGYVGRLREAGAEWVVRTLGEVMGLAGASITDQS
jgi:HAD superfamily hydrolase (TIGR01509 family)